MQEKPSSAQFHQCIRPFYAFLMPLGRIIGRWAMFFCQRLNQPTIKLECIQSEKYGRPNNFLFMSSHCIYSFKSEIFQVLKMIEASTFDATRRGGDGRMLDRKIGLSLPVKAAIAVGKKTFSPVEDDDGFPRAFPKG